MCSHVLYRSYVLVMCVEATWVITRGLWTGLLRARLFVLAWAWRIPGALGDKKKRVEHASRFIPLTYVLTYAFPSSVLPYFLLCQISHFTYLQFLWVNPLSPPCPPFCVNLMEACSDQSVAGDYRTVCGNWIWAASMVTELGKSREPGVSADRAVERDGVSFGDSQRRKT